MKVVIANPESRGQCSDSNLGEIWVQSAHNTSGNFAVFGPGASGSGAIRGAIESSSARGDAAEADSDPFCARLMTGDTRTSYARTGFLGFVRRTDAIGCDGEPHDALFVVGSLEETLVLRGMRYHPVDIEASVLRADKRICEWLVLILQEIVCAFFKKNRSAYIK